MALASPQDWSARFISPVDDSLDGPAPMLSRELTVHEGLVDARLHASALGVYQARIDGRPVGDIVLPPGWTSYEHRLGYQTYDVTALLTPGRHEISALLGNGWYRGHLTNLRKRDLYGDRLALLAQLELTYRDRPTERVVTDTSWTSRPSHVLRDDLYDGQETDLRLVDMPERSSGKVEVLDEDLSRIGPADRPPVRVLRTVPAQTCTVDDAGRVIVDFGENLVGRARLTVRDGRPGDRVVVRHAEILQDGRLCTEPLRSARATDTYHLAGGATETLEPSLTFHGFRYAEVSGVDGIRPEDVTAVVLGTDLDRTGWFRSGHELLDRFHENVVRSARGNFLAVPTDCPQRDERLGWTGDIQVFAPTAAYLFDVGAFLSGWLADLAAEQHPDGGVPFVVPDVLRDAEPAAAAWGDASVVVPWVIYQRLGDAGLLRRQLGSMCAWVDREAELAGDDLIWDRGHQFGDWLDPDAPPDNPAAAQCPPHIVATAHLARSAELVALTGKVLDEPETAARYADLAARARQAFVGAFVEEDGRIHSDSQTAYAMALCWNLLPDAGLRKSAGEHLARRVRDADFTVSTGFVGTPLILDALTDTGHSDLAFRMLFQTRCPSWLYPVTMGATTIWERWDSLRPDGTVNDSGMTSFNHYALGAVADWMHRRIGGLEPTSPGYRTVSIAPLLPDELDGATTRHDSPYGEIEAGWHREPAGRIRMSARLPHGTSGIVRSPDGQSLPVGPGSHEFTITLPETP
jgi:alpha-L-rhamnosidase